MRENTGTRYVIIAVIIAVIVVDSAAACLQDSCLCVIAIACIVYSGVAVRILLIFKF